MKRTNWNNVNKSANNKTNSDLLLEDGVSLDIKCFPDFIESRKRVLLKKLKEILNVEESGVELSNEENN